MDVTVLKAKSNLSALLRKAEAGDLCISVGAGRGARFRIVPERGVFRGRLTEAMIKGLRLGEWTGIASMGLEQLLTSNY